MQVKEPLPPLREDTHGVIPYADPKLSLFNIEQEKLDLIQFRDECETDEERAAVDQQIQEYIGREIRKVSGIAALLKYFKAQAATAKAEEERAAKWRKKWEANYERLKNMVHGVMLALDLPKVEGATDRFRRQKNPVALEITDAKLIPEQYLKATIKMPLSAWKELIACDAPGLARDFTVTSEVDTASVKAALQVKVKCALCDGTGLVDEEGCNFCRGEKAVAQNVPGARLVQGEHLRVE